jgi:cysteine-rich repeat protein
MIGTLSEGSGQTKWVTLIDDGGAGACARIQRSLDQGAYRVTALGGNGVALPRYVLNAILAPEPNECGNGRLEVGEDCDDGNRDGGDGCSGECRTE